MNKKAKIRGIITKLYFRKGFHYKNLPTRSKNNLFLSENNNVIYK